MAIKYALILLLCICTRIALAQPVLYLEPGGTKYSLDPYIGVYEDKDDTSTIDQMSGAHFASKFIYFNGRSINLKFSNSAIWLRVIIADTLTGNPSGSDTDIPVSRWILSNNDPLTEEVALYFPNPADAGGNFSVVYAGRGTDFYQKEIHLNDFIGSFSLTGRQKDTLFIRVKSPSQLILSFNMLSAGEYAIQSAKSNMFHGILFGIFFILVAYNLILYFSIKNNIYIYYILYITFFAAFLFLYHGHFTEIFGYTDVKTFYLTMLAFLTMAATSWVLLTREFLYTNKYFPAADIILVVLTPLAPLTLILMFIFMKPYFAAILALQFLIYYIIGLVVAVLAVQKNITLAKYYMLALLGITITVFISVSTRNNFLPLPWNFWTINSISIGVLWEALILAGSVGYIFNDLKIEKEREKSLIRSQIASDLHDEVGSNLSTISLQSRVIMQQPDLTQKMKTQLQNISTVAAATTETIRDIVWFINPYHDSSDELYFRMKELASKMLVHASYEFTSTQKEKIFDNIPDLNKRRHIYMIFKESLNNIAKHADAKEVMIHLTEKNFSFTMSIIDDGKGFQDSDIKPGEGLANLHNRAKLAGGTMTIESRKGGGTYILLEIPL